PAPVLPLFPYTTLFRSTIPALVSSKRIISRAGKIMLCFGSIRPAIASYTDRPGQSGLAFFYYHQALGQLYFFIFSRAENFIDQGLDPWIVIGIVMKSDVAPRDQKR